MQARDFIQQTVLHHLILLIHQVVGGALPTVEVPFDANVVHHYSGVLFVVEDDCIIRILVTEPTDIPMVISPSDERNLKICRLMSATEILIALGFSSPTEKPNALFADIIRNITSPHTSSMTPLQLAISCLLNVVHPDNIGVVRDIVRLFGIGNIRNVINSSALIEILAVVRANVEYPFDANTLATLRHFGIYLHQQDYMWRVVPSSAKFAQSITSCSVHLNPICRKKFNERFMALTDATIPGNILIKKVRAFYNKYGKNAPGLDRIFTRSSILGVLLEIVKE